MIKKQNKKTTKKPTKKVQVKKEQNNDCLRLGQCTISIETIPSKEVNDIMTEKAKECVKLAKYRENFATYMTYGTIAFIVLVIMCITHLIYYYLGQKALIVTVLLVAIYTIVTIMIAKHNHCKFDKIVNKGD